MARKDTSDEAFKQMISQLESGKQYKVLTQHEYEALLAISSRKDLTVAKRYNKQVTLRQPVPL